MPVLNENSFVLSIGVGKRPGDKEPMKTTADDAEYIRDVLHESYNVSIDRVITRTNEKATKGVIREELITLKEKTKNNPADLVIVYFSGHGFVVNNRYFLICNDTDDENVEDTALEGTEFVTLLNEIETDKMLIILDCCHAKGMTQALSGKKVANIPFDKNKFLKTKQNRLVLTACHESQVSYSSKPVSIFTYALLEGLGGKYFLDGDTDVRVFELAMYIRERVAALSQSIEEPQTPYLDVLNDTTTDNFTLATYPNGKPRVIKLEDLVLWTTDDDAKEINKDVETVRDEKFRSQLLVKFKNSISQKLEHVTAGRDVNVTQVTNIFQNYNNGETKIVEEIFSVQKVLDDIYELTSQENDNRIAIAINKFSKINQDENFKELVDDFENYKKDMQAGLATKKGLKAITERLRNMVLNFSAGKGIKEEDKIFETLCLLDFKFQDGHYKKLIESRKFATFVIRGEGICGQRWLSRQLIKRYSTEYDYIFLDVEDQNADSMTLISAILEDLGNEENLTGYPVRTKCKIAADLLMARAETKDQFILLKRSFRFINSPLFNEFFTFFIENLNLEKHGPKYKPSAKKIVVFFIEETIEAYQTANSIKYVYLEKMNPYPLKCFIDDWKGQKFTTSIVGFHPISNIDVGMLSDWLSLHAAEYISKDFFPEEEDKEQKQAIFEFYTDCSNGNPEMIIHNISKKLNYNYQWIKY